jgi:hypothetical protein
MPLLWNKKYFVFLPLDVNPTPLDYVIRYIFLLIIGHGSRPFLPISWEKLQILCHPFFDPLSILRCLALITHQQQANHLLSLVIILYCTTYIGSVMFAEIGVLLVFNARSLYFLSVKTYIYFSQLSKYCYHVVQTFGSVYYVLFSGCICLNC